MKAAVLTAYGDIDKLVLRDLPEPTAGPGEIKVRVAGASITPIDWKLRKGEAKARMPLVLPAVLGRDASGVVTEVGAGVAGFAIGDRVMGVVNGGYAQFVVARSDVWAHVPGNMDLVEAGALPLVLLTGAQLIEEAVKPKEGDRVLVVGATGSVGRAAVYAARVLGARVWAGVRGRQKAAAEKLGVEGVIALDDEWDMAEVPELDSIADTVGGDTVQKVLGKAKWGGTLGSVVGEPAAAKSLGLKVHTLMSHPDGARLATLAKAVADGQLVIPIADKLPLAEVRKAQTLAEAGASGKVLLTA